MRRGEVWTLSGGPDYAGKPRPAVVLQDERFDATASIIVCPLTSHTLDAPLFRLPVEPSSANGLRRPSMLMIDKLTAVPRSKMGARLGQLEGEDMVRLNRAVLVFLGMA